MNELLEELWTMRSAPSELNCTPAIHSNIFEENTLAQEGFVPVDIKYKAM
jgi:hypothetical protein